MVRASLLAEYSALQPSILTFPDVFVFVFLVFRDRVFLYSPGCPGTYSVDQASLKLKNPPASASQVLELKAWAITTARQTHLLNMSSSPNSVPLLSTSFGYTSIQITALMKIMCQARCTVLLVYINSCNPHNLMLGTSSNIHTSVLKCKEGK